MSTMPRSSVARCVPMHAFSGDFAAMIEPVKADVDVVKSPCISVCALSDDGICIGCWRSVDEIAVWSELDNERKREVVKNACQRAKESGNWL